jgi:hypothetical protein
MHGLGQIRMIQPRRRHPPTVAALTIIQLWTDMSAASSTGNSGLRTSSMLGNLEGAKRAYF